MLILRHNEKYSIGSDLNPIEDILNLMCSFKSLGYTSDVLKEVHGFKNSTEIKKTSKLISLHINNAQSLAEQGLEGSAETSFLPLYYCTLNFMKVHLLFLGKREDLEKNRWHGAKYSEKEMSRQFLNEKIYIGNKGTIPLIYSSITKNKVSKNGIKLTLKEIYQNISSIDAEYSTVTKSKSTLLLHSTTIEKDDLNGHYLKIFIAEKNFQSSPPSPRKLKAYNGIKLVKDKNGLYHYETKKIKGDFNFVKKILLKGVERNLLSDITLSGVLNNDWYSFTPISGKKYVFNEELNIMLAYFHLSNVVRYNPEHLHKLMDSKYWIIMLALRKHGFLRFQKLLYGNYIGKSFDLN